MRWLLDVMYTVCPKRRQYSDILTVQKSAEIRYPDDVRWGRSTNLEDAVTVTFQDIMNTCELDLKYSFTKIRGKIYYQKIGCPIGGFLSSLYANTVCAYHEWMHTSSMSGNGIRTYGIRQIDDLVQWFAYKVSDKRSKTQAIRMKKKVLKTDGVYKGGLELEEQKVEMRQKGNDTYAIHQFAGLEIHIRTRDQVYYCRTLNKNRESIEKNGNQKLVRYPPWHTYMERQALKGVIIGSIYRIISQCESNNPEVKVENLIYECILENLREHESIGYPTRFYKAVVKRVMKSTSKGNDSKTMKVQEVLKRILREA